METPSAAVRARGAGSSAAQRGEPRQLGRGARAAGSPRTARPRRCRSRRPRRGRRARGRPAAPARARRGDDQLVGAVGLARGAPPARAARPPLEHALADRDRRHVAHAGGDRLGRGGVQRARATERSSAPLISAAGCISQAAAGDQHGVAVAEVAAAGERLAEGGRARTRRRARSGCAYVAASIANALSGGDRARASAAAAARAARARSTSSRWLATLLARSGTPGSCGSAPTRARRRARASARRPVAPARKSTCRRARPRGTRAGSPGRSRSCEAWSAAVTRSAVDQPAVGGARGLHHALRQRRVAVDDARDLRVAALERASR